jgi:hypothetical protein
MIKDANGFMLKLPLMLLMTWFDIEVLLCQLIDSFDRLFDGLFVELQRVVGH